MSHHLTVSIGSSLILKEHTMAMENTSASTSFKSDIDGLSRQAGVVGHDVATLAHDAAGAARHGAAELREGASHAVDAAKAKLAQGADYAKKQFADAQDQVSATAKSMNKYVGEHPLTSIGVALGVGVVVGMLLSRSRS